jgi:uncharacterized membrane protein YozB (DUF420 family)
VSMLSSRTPAVGHNDKTLRCPLQGALYLLPLVLHLTLEAIHVALALFAVTQTCQVIPRTSYVHRVSVRSSAAVLIAALVSPRSPSAAPAQNR